MVGEQGGKGLDVKANDLTGAQAGVAIIAAPGAGYAIRIHSAQVIAATGSASLHHDDLSNNDKKFVSAKAGADGKFEPTRHIPFWQLPPNEALKITSTGDVAYSLVYEIVYTDKKPLGGPHA